MKKEGLNREKGVSLNINKINSNKINKEFQSKQAGGIL